LNQIAIEKQSVAPLPVLIFFHAPPISQRYLGGERAMTAPEDQSCQQATLRQRILSDLLFFDRNEHLQRFVLLAQ
jgi:hypothetical protein